MHVTKLTVLKYNLKTTQSLTTIWYQENNFE